MLAKRIVTSLVLAPLMIGGIFFLPLHQFALFIGLIVVFGGWEWANMAGWQKTGQRVVYVLILVAMMALLYLVKDSMPWVAQTVLWLAALWWLISVWVVARYPDLPAGWFSQTRQLILGGIVLLPMWVGLYQLKQLPESTLWIVYLMFVVWGADVGAYFIGRAFGRRKLAPKVSPGKSWEGVFGGLLTVFIVATAAGLYISDRPDFSLIDWLTLFIGSAVVMAASILGDLVESMTKRHRGIKDSSNLLPGHGGVMDRADSLTAAVPVSALLLNLLLFA